MPGTDLSPTRSPGRRAHRRRWLVGAAVALVAAAAVAAVVVARGSGDGEGACAPDDSAVVTVDDYTVSGDDPIDIAQLYEVEVQGTVTNQGPVAIVVASIDVPVVGGPAQTASTDLESIELGPDESSPFVATGYVTSPAPDVALEPDGSSAAVEWEPLDLDAARC